MLCLCFMNIPRRLCVYKRAMQVVKTFSKRAENVGRNLSCLGYGVANRRFCINSPTTQATSYFPDCTNFNHSRQCSSERTNYRVPTLGSSAKRPRIRPPEDKPFGGSRFYRVHVMRCLLWLASI